MHTRSSQQLIREVGKLLEDPSPLAEPRRWAVNGQRGHWHADSLCWKVKHSARRITGPMTTPGVTMCPNCFHHAVSGVGVQWRAALDLLAVRDTLARVESLVGEATTASQVMHIQPTLREAARALEKLQPNAEHVWSAYQETTTALQTLTARASKATRKGRDEVLRWAACAAVHADLRHPAAATQFGDAPEPHGRVRIPGRPQLPEIARVWAETLTSSGSAKQAAEAARAHHQATTRLQTVAQLTGVPSRHDAPSDAMVAAEQAWQQHVNEHLESLLASWTSQYRAASKNAEPVLLGVHRTHTHTSVPTANATLETFSVYPARRGERAVMLLPRYVADAVLAHAAGWSWTGTHIAGPCPDQAAAQTAATLWEPYSDGPYRQLSAALTAAASLG